jgi:uncharacterized protein YwgA
MNDYWLAKLIGSVEEVDSRKRLQKSIYLLQFLKGFPLQLDYFLHFYGPYSWELADLIGQLESSRIIEEKCEDGMAYKSHITDYGKEIIEKFETSNDGIIALKKISHFIPSFQDLSKESRWVLELASTVAFYYSDNWGDAKEQTVKFKSVNKNDTNLNKATRLAKKFLEPN